MPLMMMRVGTGTSKVMPSGASTRTGWEKPSASSSALGPGAMAHTDDLELLGEALGHARDHVGDERARQAVQRTVTALVVGPADLERVAFLRDGDPLGELPFER